MVSSISGRRKGAYLVERNHSDIDLLVLVFGFPLAQELPLTERNLGFLDQSKSFEGR